MKNIKTYESYISEGKNPFTLKEYEAYLKKLLSTSVYYSKRGLKVVYRNQSEDEKRGYASLAYDSKGFTRYDASELSRILTLVVSDAKLSDRDQQLLFEKMPKYWKQIYKASDKDKLHKMMNNGRQIKMNLN